MYSDVTRKMRIQQLHDLWTTYLWFDGFSSKAMKSLVLSAAD